MFLKNVWYAAGWANDFVGIVAMTLLNERVAIYRTSDGSLVAMEDRCPHRLAPLSVGRCEGDNIRCLYHGLLFAPDGKCLSIPGQDTIPPAVRVRTYPIVERHAVVWIWMGNPAMADRALIPEFVGPEHPDWAMIPGHMDYEANYELINDNLLDLSHISWVHAASFGGGDSEANAAWAKMPVTITSLDRGVRVSRWSTNSPMPPYLKWAGEKADVLSVYEFLVPGIFLLWSSFYPAGTARGLANGEEPKSKALHCSFTCQAVTPHTDRKTRYIFGFGPEAENAHLAEAFRDLGVMAFSEDKAMIEAQQQVIDNDPSRRMLHLAMDGATKRYAGVVARLRKEEQLAAA